MVIRESKEQITIEGIVQLCCIVFKNLHLKFYKKENYISHVENRKNIFEENNEKKIHLNL